MSNSVRPLLSGHTYCVRAEARSPWPGAGSGYEESLSASRWRRSGGRPWPPRVARPRPSGWAQTGHWKAACTTGVETGTSGSCSTCSNCRASCSILERRGPARNPKKRIRTKPRGKVCSKNRRRNSSLETVILRFLLPTEGDRLTVEGEESVVGDGDPMSIPGQVLQQVVGAAEGRFGLLLDRGADINARATSGCSALMAAVQGRDAAPLCDCC
jgi:hypothetical protein